jgi:hypothetical protein
MINENILNSRRERSDASACYAIFHGDGGYPDERERAKKVFRVGGQYRIVGGTMGQSSTCIEIEGVDGRWNSVLFHYDETIAPIDFPYIRHNNQ